MIMIQCNDDLFVKNYQDDYLSLDKTSGMYFVDMKTAELNLEIIKKQRPTMKFELVKVEIKRTVLKG